MGPVVSEVSSQLSDQVTFYDVDVDQSPNLARQFGVMSIPTMILFKNGEEVDRAVGFAPEEAVTEFAAQ
ncbi:thioredoxin family protein [Mesobacillus harenae]|uniref:thioredoxin family protein n=1 Tax=Mesobacillus harenae TaxID=2213203 RepID=UPI001F54B103|nr:thioredoxin domain-containing protein [Mesobacillus harenae]